MLEALFVWSPRVMQGFDETGATALHHAAKEGRLEAVRWLLARREHGGVGWLDALERTTACTALHLGTLCQHYEIVEALLVAGANTLIEDGSCETPLDTADACGDERLAELIRSHGGKDRSFVHESQRIKGCQ